MDCIDTIEQIFSEFSVIYHFLQITVGGTNQADVDRHRAIASHSHDASSLNGSQQFGLQMIGQVSYLVKE